MGSIDILLIIIVYFALLLLISFFTGRKSTDNKAFFTGNRKSPWWLVSIGMVGASVSGVSFISVPGMVRGFEFTYLQTVMGFVVGYIVVAQVLLPLYYKLNVTSIYTYLYNRFGNVSYKTGASFFLLSKTISAAARLYIVALILQKMVFDAWGIPFYITVTGIMVLIWVYTYRSGIKSIVWTDSLQTFVMVVALVLMVVQMMQLSNLSWTELSNTIVSDDTTRIFVFDDWVSKQHFVKQFFSGIFIVVVMTGLDQDMMQKNLSCKNVVEAKRNMQWYGWAFIPVNLLLLVLGFLILYYASQQGIVLPAKGDEILPFIASSYVSYAVLLCFVLGVTAAAFSSVDSALTALTTSFMVDILGKPNDDNTADQTSQLKRLRISVHAGISFLFIVIILGFAYVDNSSIIDTIYILVSYSYGPLLGLYSFGLFTKLPVWDKVVPFIAILAPFLCLGVDRLTWHLFDYAFGYELLLLNGGLTFMGLLISSKYGNKNS